MNTVLGHKQQGVLGGNLDGNDAVGLPLSAWNDDIIPATQYSQYERQFGSQFGSQFESQF